MYLLLTLSLKVVEINFGNFHFDIYNILEDSIISFTILLY